MTEISRCDVIAAIGEADELIIQEALRTKCSALEFRRALSFADGSANGDAASYAGLPTRVQRLVDLLGVALDHAQGNRKAQAVSMRSARNRHAA